MKKILFIISFVCLFLIQGCAGGQWVTVKYTPINPTPGGYIKSYTPGKIKTAFIGQEIIKVEICDYMQKSFISDSDISVDAYYQSKHIQIKGSNINHQYPITGTIVLNGKTYYLTKEMGSDFRYWGVLISDDGVIYKNRLYSYDWEMLYVSDNITITAGNYISATNCSRAKPTSISFELIFAGKNDISLNATYKEYSVSDHARPAFFQNITYQANAKQIRFKDFVIQIHSCTNEQITYTVIEDGLK